MKDFDGIIIGLFVIAAALILFLGVKQLAQKSFSQPPPQNPNAQSHYLSKQHRLAQETKAKHRLLRQQQRQRMRDAQRHSN